MKRIRERVASLDVHRDTVVACCQVKQPDRSIEVTKQSFATTANGLGQLAAWLSDADVETVAMEATGVYWKPVYYCLEGLFDELWLCNAQYVTCRDARAISLTPSGSPTSRLTAWSVRASCPRRRSGNSATSPATERPKPKPGPRRSSALRRPSRMPASSCPRWRRRSGASRRGR